ESEQIALRAHRRRPFAPERAEMYLRRAGRHAVRFFGLARAIRCPVRRCRSRRGRLRHRERAVQDEREDNEQRAEQDLLATISCHWPPAGNTSTARAGTPAAFRPHPCRLSRW